MDEASRKRLLKKLRGTRSLSELGDVQWQQALGKEVPRPMWRSTKLVGVDRLCWSPDGRVLLVVMSNCETHFLETQHGAVLFSSQLRQPPSDLHWLPALDSHLGECHEQRRRCFAELIDCFCTMNFCLLYLQAAFDLAVEGWESKPGALVKDLSTKLLPTVRLFKECQTSLHSALYNLLRVDTSECEVGIESSSRFISTLLSIQSDPLTNFPDADEDALKNSTAASILSDLADDLSSLEEVLEKAMRLAEALDDATTA